MEIKDLFIVRATNEENNDFIVTIGKHLATEQRFKTKQEALKYIEKPKWDTIGALIGEMIEAHKIYKQINDDTKKLANTIENKTKEEK